MISFQLPLAPAPQRDVLIRRAAVIALADRLFAEGRTVAARAFEERMALIKDNEPVPVQRAIAERYGLTAEG